MLGFFGSAGLPLVKIDAAIEKLQQNLQHIPFGFNLIHSPNGPNLLKEIDAVMYRNVTEKKDWLTEMKQQIEMMESRGDSVLTAVWDIVENSRFKKPNPKDYIGTYRDNWFGDVEIWLDDNNELWFRSHRSPKLTGSMHYYRANTFAIKWNYTDMPCDAFAMFSLDENGKAINIRMKAISPNTDFSFDFHDLDLRRIAE